MDKILAAVVAVTVLCSTSTVVQADTSEDHDLHARDRMLPCEAASSSLRCRIDQYQLALSRLHQFDGFLQATAGYLQQLEEVEQVIIALQLDYDTRSFYEQLQVFEKEQGDLRPRHVFALIYHQVPSLQRHAEAVALDAREYAASDCPRDVSPAECERWASSAIVDAYTAEVMTAVRVLELRLQAVLDSFSIDSVYGELRVSSQ